MKIPLLSALPVLENVFTLYVIRVTELQKMAQALTVAEIRPRIPRTSMVHCRVRQEPEIGPVTTRLDYHRDGLERFVMAEITAIAAIESYVHELVEAPKERDKNAAARESGRCQNDYQINLKDTASA
ncbi:hypothetical protein LTR10_022382 [Elasticomyces elasticus]|uniref:Uncharacterized protein n=1 Tax=Exophiala sideris TaxID=1016849 RepID=A0ABR0J7C8_9EURO|nr:hypothetical protein LTR10_022382 [Elasticomyces elasticus]KAK5029547.1 hypothetical protein LTS07_006010 [Exophiala sideris]KAK5036759.1 hypothetical protein LTR13_005139 [Exophiala sideris]KAK5058176.1 hypothetical protein LTR69_007174 [Exophiala sideris]KAK5182136.1 hypothetical protein LTR44_005737 [Eurotiomycetes sp. CCFEE 6388]